MAASESQLPRSARAEISYEAAGVTLSRLHAIGWFYQSNSSLLPHFTLQPESPVPPDELEQTSLPLLQPDSTRSGSEYSDKACKPSTLSIFFLLVTWIVSRRSYHSSSSELPHWTLQPESPVPPDELEQTPLLLLQPVSSVSENSDKACKPRTLSISFSFFY